MMHLVWSIQWKLAGPDKLMNNFHNINNTSMSTVEYLRQLEWSLYHLSSLDMSDSFRSLAADSSRSYM
jgi:hypothetical protein